MRNWIVTFDVLLGVEYREIFVRANTKRKAEILAEKKLRKECGDVFAFVFDIRETEESEE